MNKNPAIGEFVGKYRIESVLGKGFTSTVFKAKHKYLNTDVALKVLSSEFIEKDSNLKNIFFNEALNNAKLIHNNLVRIIDIDDESEYTYIVMEYINGLTLDSIIGHLGFVYPLKTLHIALEICRALKHCLNFNIIHRDIKPANIMITKNSDVKLTDFGLSKQLNETNKFDTAKGDIFGTPYYMSPEQFMNSEKVDHRSDMYSLGVTLYQMVTGKLPFQTNNLGELIAMHVNDIPVRPEQYSDKVTFEFSRLIMKLLSKDPELRYSNYDSLINDLEKIEVNYKVAEISSSDYENNGFKNTFGNSLLEKIEHYQKEFKNFSHSEVEEDTDNYEKINISEEEIIGRVLNNLNKQYNDIEVNFKNENISENENKENKNEFDNSDKLKQRYQKYFKRFSGVDINDIVSEKGL